MNIFLHLHHSYWTGETGFSEIGLKFTATMHIMVYADKGKLRQMAHFAVRMSLSRWYGAVGGGQGDVDKSSS